MDEPALQILDVDWRKSNPFAPHNWHDYRTRKNRSLKSASDFRYEKYPKKDNHTACVKVIDVFGCDTSITVEISI